MLGDSNRLVLRAARVQIPDVVRKLLAILEVDRLISFGAALPNALTRLGVRQAFLFCSLQRGFLDKQALSFIAAPRAAEPNDDDSQRRLLAASPSEGGVAAR